MNSRARTVSVSSMPASFVRLTPSGWVPLAVCVPALSIRVAHSTPKTPAIRWTGYEPKSSESALGEFKIDSGASGSGRSIACQPAYSGRRQPRRICLFCDPSLGRWINRRVYAEPKTRSCNGP